MKVEDLIGSYEAKKEKHGKQTYRYISQLLREAKARHKQDFGGTDHEQSWRSFKGKNFEKLIEHIITAEVRALGMEIVNGNKLERTDERNLPADLAQVKRNLLIDYGEFGYHLPDVDLIIYDPRTQKVVVVLFIKVTLRERIAQTEYWKIKLQSQELTQHIKVYIVTLDEDATLKGREPAKKGRAIVEMDLDGGYVLSEANIDGSDRVKMFEEFLSDLKALL